MYLLYADESGDTGHLTGSTRYFVISGLVVHELRWHEILGSLVEFRRTLRARYGLKLREEIHTYYFLHKPGAVRRIPKSIRLHLLRDLLDFQESLTGVNIINVVVDKRGKMSDYDVFDNAWRALIQRFHNTISHHNFPGPTNPQDLGLLIVDKTDEKKLRHLVRRMRAYNPVPSQFGGSYRHLPLTTVAEDAIHKDSLHCYFTQICDLNAYFLYQKHQPAGYIKRKGARNYFDRLDPILCKVASKADVQGIVRL